MGFRSTLTSEHYSGTLPEWFKDKYKDRLSFPDGLLLASISEWKYYNNELFEDFHKALIEIDFWYGNSLEVNLAVLAEDGTISKVIVSKEGIRYIIMVSSYIHDSVWMQ